jgi:medium-chain acyl-[acyl-carrier-protein] hydrolase
MVVDVLLHIPNPRPTARIRIVCFPYAGGNVSTFLSWQHLLSPDLELVVVQLPGRGVRFSEPVYDSMDELVGDLFFSIEKLMDKPFIFFGHSMGARVAYEVSLMLYKYQRAIPMHFFASGSAGPQVQYPQRDIIHQLPEKAFIARLAAMNGTSSELLCNEEIMSLLMPALRADFKIIETYTSEAKVILPCWVTVLSGDDDDIQSEHLEAWFKLFEHNSGIHMMRGDHFFIDKNPGGVLAVVEGCLQELC